MALQSAFFCFATCFALCPEGSRELFSSAARLKVYELGFQVFRVYGAIRLDDDIIAALQGLALNTSLAGDPAVSADRLVVSDWGR